MTTTDTPFPVGTVLRSTAGKCLVTTHAHKGRSVDVVQVAETGIVTRAYYLTDNLLHDGMVWRRVGAYDKWTCGGARVAAATLADETRWWLDLTGMGGKSFDSREAAMSHVAEVVKSMDAWRVVTGGA